MQVFAILKRRTHKCSPSVRIDSYGQRPKGHNHLWGIDINFIEREDIKPLLLSWVKQISFLLLFLEHCYLSWYIRQNFKTYRMFSELSA